MPWKTFAVQIKKNSHFQMYIFATSSFVLIEEITSGAALQLLNPVATIFSPGPRIHTTYMVGMINGPLGFALYYIHYRLSNFTYVVERWFFCEKVPLPYLFKWFTIAYVIYINFYLIEDLCCFVGIWIGLLVVAMFWHTWLVSLGLKRFHVKGSEIQTWPIARLLHQLWINKLFPDQAKKV